MLYPIGEAARIVIRMSNEARDKPTVREWIEQGNIWDTSMQTWEGVDIKLRISVGTMTEICELLYAEGVIIKENLPNVTLYYSKLIKNTVGNTGEHPHK